MLYPQLPRTWANIRAACGEVKIGEKIMVYAIVENGGKQYKAVEGGILEVDFQPVEAGKKIVLDKVLLLVDNNGAQIGTPLLKNVQVETTVTEHFKGPKITIFNYRPKERYRVKTGHRQQYMRLIVDSIVYPGKSKSEKKAETVAVEPKVKTVKAAVKKASTAKPKTVAVKKTVVKKAK
jgi:large subunit ribosomal protein L21